MLQHRLALDLDVDTSALLDVGLGIEPHMDNSVWSNNRLNNNNSRFVVGTATTTTDSLPYDVLRCENWTTTSLNTWIAGRLDSWKDHIDVAPIIRRSDVFSGLLQASGMSVMDEAGRSWDAWEFVLERVANFHVALRLQLEEDLEYSGQTYSVSLEEWLEDRELEVHDDESEVLDEAKRFMQPHRRMFSDRLWLCADPSCFPLTPSPGPRVTYRTHFMVPDIMAEEVEGGRMAYNPTLLLRSGAARVE